MRSIYLSSASEAFSIEIASPSKADILLEIAKVNSSTISDFLDLDVVSFSSSEINNFNDRVSFSTVLADALRIFSIDIAAVSALLEKAIKAVTPAVSNPISKPIEFNLVTKLNPCIATVAPAILPVIKA